MKCQILFSGKNKKNITDLLSAELAKRVIKVKVVATICCKGDNFCDFLFAFLHTKLL